MIRPLCDHLKASSDSCDAGGLRNAEQPLAESAARTLQTRGGFRRLSVFAGLLLFGLALGVSSGCSDDTSSQEWDITDPQNEEESDAGDSSPDADDPGHESDAADDEGDITVVPVPVSVETRLSPSTATAGSTVQVECRLLSEDGETVSPPEGATPRLVLSPAQSFLSPQGLSLVPTVAGHASVACQFASLSLVDDTPAELEILPGAPHTVTTELDTHSITAGGEATATCEVYDAYQNRIDDAVTSVQVDSSGSGVEIDDHTVRLKRAGIHEVTCTVDGAQETYGEFLEVNPGLPASLAVAKSPDRPYYGIGQAVELVTIVTDEFNNPIDDARVSFAQQNAGGQDNSFGHGRYRFEQDGTYTIFVTVEPPTYRDHELTETVEIKVNGQGPSIECLSPANGTMEDITPGSMVTFQGRVQDAHGVGEVRVNGDTVTVNSSGIFEKEISTRFGINFVDITATDSLDPEFSQENSTTCAFLAADTWGSEKVPMADAVALWLAQAAVDDGNSSGPINSLNDVLHKALNSDGLTEQLDSALSAQGRLVEGCVDVWLTCIDYHLDYKSSNLGGPNNTTLTLINDGLKLKAVIRDAMLEVQGTASGKVTIETLTGELEVNLSLQNGRPKITLRANSVNVTSGKVNLDIKNVPGFLDSLISSLFQNNLRNVVEAQVANLLKNQLQEVLDSMISGLDISALGSTFNVPRLDGQGEVALDFDVNFSSLSVNPTRALFGLGTRFDASPMVRATPSEGVAMPSGDTLLTSNPGTPIAAGVHVGALNHVLHALWRGGLFDAAISSDAIGASFPEGTEITMSTGLPPVAALSGPQKLELMLGAVRMSIVYPGLFDEPIELELGAVAESSLAIQQSGGEPSLDFSNIEIQELYFSPVAITLDEQSRAVLENFLTGVLQNLIDTSLNNALPALPIPSFTLPDTLNAYGLPGGSSLGIMNPSLGGGGRHLQIKGSFGVLP